MLEPDSRLHAARNIFPCSRAEMSLNSPRTTQGCTPTKSINRICASPRRRLTLVLSLPTETIQTTYRKLVSFRRIPIIRVHRRPNLLPPISPPVHALSRNWLRSVNSHTIPQLSFRLPPNFPWRRPGVLLPTHKPGMPRSSPKTPHTRTPTKSPRLPAEPSLSLCTNLPNITIKATYKKLASFRQFPA